MGKKLISLGTIPATSLKEAREKAIEARKAIENGIDPSAQRKLDKQLAQNTFALVAMEWIERQKTKWSPGYADTAYCPAFFEGARTGRKRGNEGQASLYRTSDTTPAFQVLAGQA